MRAGLALALFIALPLVGCRGGSANAPAEGENPRVSDAWIRLAAVPASPSAAYFTIHGGKADDRLMRIASPQVKRAEVHATMAAGHGMSMMTPLSEVSVPAGGTVSFAPASRHVMLFGLDPAVTPGREVRLDFVFASGRRLSTEAQVRAMGDGGQ